MIDICQPYAFGATKRRLLRQERWCRIQLVVSKYRRKVLVGDTNVEQRLKHILYARAQQYGVLIETMEVRPDHVHLFVS